MYQSLDACIKANDFPCIIHNSQHVYPVTANKIQTLYEKAIQYDNIDCLKYLHDTFKFAIDMRLYQHAVVFDSPKCFEYILKHGKGILEELEGMWYAFMYHQIAAKTIEFNGIKCLKYLWEHDCFECRTGQFAQNMCNIAAYHNRLECLQYLHEYRSQYSPEQQHDNTVLNISTCEIAARRGSLPCLKYVCKRVSALNNNLCPIAYENKHWWCILYLLSIGCYPNGFAYLIKCFTFGFVFGLFAVLIM
jgi:hypothetical protein